MDRTPYTLYSGFADYAPKEKPGEVFFWRQEFDFFKDADPKTQPSGSEVSTTSKEDLNQSITKIAAYLKLGRGQQLILEPATEVGRKIQVQVPSPNSRQRFDNFSLRSSPRHTQKTKVTAGSRPLRHSVYSASSNGWPCDLQGPS